MAKIVNPLSIVGSTPIGNIALTASDTQQTGIDVSAYATASVAPTPSETKTVTENGTVTPTSGKLLSSVVVNVQGGGATEPYIEEEYYSNGDLKTVVFHGYTSIRANMFKGCSNFYVEIPNEITKIGSYAFYGCSVFDPSSLPSGLGTIDSNTFYGCSRMVLGALPSGITGIGSYAFYGCGKLSITEIPSGVTSIGNYAFNACNALTALTFKGRPTTISSSAFSSCSNLRTINVPWVSGAVSGAPWGATNATINYDYTGA